MKNRFCTLALMIGLMDLVSTTSLKSQFGCMDDSKYLAEKFDTKELHYVQCHCSCPQGQIVQPHNQCLDCGHYHAKPAWEIIKGQPLHIKEPYMSPKLVLDPAQRDVEKILRKLATTIQLQGS